MFDGDSSSLLISYIDALRHLVPTPEAIALGGSCAVGSADRYSDLDLFVVFPALTSDYALTTFVQDMSEILVPRPISAKVDGWVVDFGYCTTFVHERLQLVDVFICDWASLPSSAMVQRLVILDDTDQGRFGRHVDSVLSDLPAAGGRSLERAWVDFAVSAQFAIKHLQRGDLLSGRLQLVRLIDQVVAVENARFLDEPFISYGGSQKADKTLGTAYLSPIFQLANVADIQQGVAATMSLARRFAGTVTEMLGKVPADLDIEAELERMLEN